MGCYCSTADLDCYVNILLYFGAIREFYMQTKHVIYLYSVSRQELPRNFCYIV